MKSYSEYWVYINTLLSTVLGLKLGFSA